MRACLFKIIYVYVFPRILKLPVNFNKEVLSFDIFINLQRHLTNINGKKLTTLLYKITKPNNFKSLNSNKLKGVAAFN